MLVTGTQILDWYWLVALAFGRLGHRLRPAPEAGAHNVRGRTGAGSKLALCDTISTAWYVSGRSEMAATPAGRTQRSHAEGLAATVDTARVFPFRGRRAWGLAFALGALAFGLFTVRYLVRHDLDLRQSLVPLHLDRLAAMMRDELTTNGHSARGTDSMEQQTGNSQQAALTQPDDPRMNDVVDVKNPTSAPDQEAQAPKSPATGQIPSDSVESSKGEKGKSATGKPNAQGATGNEQPKSPQQGANQNQSQPASNQTSPGLMDRMKDAMSSLMAKMNPSNSSRNAQQANAHNSEAPDADRNPSQGKKSGKCRPRLRRPREAMPVPNRRTANKGRPQRCLNHRIARVPAHQIAKAATSQNPASEVRTESKPSKKPKSCKPWASWPRSSESVRRT